MNTFVLLSLKVFWYDVQGDRPATIAFRVWIKDNPFLGSRVVVEHWRNVAVGHPIVLWPTLVSIDRMLITLKKKPRTLGTVLGSPRVKLQGSAPSSSCCRKRGAKGSQWQPGAPPTNCAVKTTAMMSNMISDTTCELQSTSIFGSYQSTCTRWTLNVSFSELASEEKESIEVSIHKVMCSWFHLPNWNLKILPGSVSSNQYIAICWGLEDASWKGGRRKRICNLNWFTHIMVFLFMLTNTLDGEGIIPVARQRGFCAKQIWAIN